MTDVVTDTPRWVEKYPRLMPTIWSLTMLPREDWPDTFDCPECGEALNIRELAEEDSSYDVTCSACHEPLYVDAKPKRIDQDDGSIRWERSVALEYDRR